LCPGVPPLFFNTLLIAWLKGVTTTDLENRNQLLLLLSFYYTIPCLFDTIADHGMIISCRW
jgi:hypothetical protein